jgi:hypothetical protein
MSDNFYTEAYNSSLYSQVGLDLVNSTGSLHDLLKRHRPETAAKIPKGASAFSTVQPVASSPQPQRPPTGLYQRNSGAANPVRVSGLENALGA